MSAAGKVLRKELRQVAVDRKSSSQRRLHVRHQESRGHALTRHVSDEEGNPAVRKCEIVEEVPPDLAGGDRDPADFTEGEPQGAPGQHLDLELPAHFQLLADPLLLDKPSLVLRQLSGHPIERPAQASQLVGRTFGDSRVEPAFRQVFHTVGQHRQFAGQPTRQRDDAHKCDTHKAQADGEVVGGGSTDFPKALTDRFGNPEKDAAVRILLRGNDPVLRRPAGIGIGRPIEAEGLQCRISLRVQRIQIPGRIDGKRNLALIARHSRESGPQDGFGVQLSNDPGRAFVGKLEARRHIQAFDPLFACLRYGLRERMDSGVRKLVEHPCILLFQLSLSLSYILPGLLHLPFDPAQVHLAAPTLLSSVARLHFRNRWNGVHHQPASIRDLDDGSRIRGHGPPRPLIGHRLRHLDEDLGPVPRTRRCRRRDRGAGARGERCRGLGRRRRFDLDGLDHVGTGSQVFEESAVDIRFRMCGILREHLDEGIRPHRAKPAIEFALYQVNPRSHRFRQPIALLEHRPAVSPFRGVEGIDGQARQGHDRQQEENQKQFSAKSHGLPRPEAQSIGIISEKTGLTEPFRSRRSILG